MYSGNWIVRLFKRIACWIEHDARGPVEGLSFEIEPGHYRPYYQCARCRRILKWQLSGGWKADT